MMEGLVTLTVALIVGFGFGLWILYRRMLPELRRETVAGATIAISPRGMATLAMVVGGGWVVLCGGILLGTYAGVPGYVVGVGIVCLIAFAQPALVKGFHPFVVRPGDGAPAKPVEGGRPTDAAVYAEHRAALERGEERALRWAVTGELHSYAKDEHVAPKNDPYKLGSLWLGIPVAGVYLSLALLPALAFVAVVAQGGQPAWVLAGVAVVFGVAGRPAFIFCRDEFRATKIRKSRGVPKPHRGPEVPLPEATEPGTAPIDLRKRPDNSA